MAGRDTTAALERAWQRPAVRAQTERATRAITTANRARVARRRTMAKVDQRIDARNDAACIETARLVWTCGSVETAAALLGMDADRVRRVLKYVEGGVGTPRPAHGRRSPRQPDATAGRPRRSARAGR